jgi:hypothetical protein
MSPITRTPLSVAEEPARKGATTTQVATATETMTLEAGHVYVHCYFNNTFKDMLIRIWKSTYLIDQGSGSRSELVHIENISYAPQWTAVPDNQLFHFLLIFSALPKSCMKFDLLEDIPQSGGFHVTDIMRNEMDVYRVDL